jgi:photosystem II stability/assembly factor-like uncharacterized protein
MRRDDARSGLLTVFVLLWLAPSHAAETGQRPLRPGDRTRGEEEQIRRREEWFMLSRGLDQVERPDLLRAAAVRELAKAQAERARTLLEAGETWEPLGPATMTMLSWVMGRVSGRVAALAVHPTDENTLYLGGASGGVWKTTNGGSSWTPILDSVGTLTIGSVAVDAANPDVVWVGTGERQGSCSSYFGLGLFRSANGGTTFEARNGTAPAGLDLSYIVSIALHPSDPQTLLVSGDAFCQGGTRLAGGVFRTTDGGATWQRVLSGTGSDVVYEPGNPNVVYAAMTSDAVYKSTNGGLTWALASTGMVTGSALGRVRLAMAPSDPQSLYALSSNDLLYRTTNGATSWTQVNADACEGQCTYNLCLDVHPSDPSTLLVGTIRFALSANGGTTLTPLTTTWGSAQKVHQDIHALRYSRTNGNRFWVAGDGGIWRSDDGGANFTNLNGNLELTQFYDVALDPNDPARVFGGAQDNSSSGRFSGQQWDVTVVTGDGFVNLVDPLTPSRVFQTSYPSGGTPSVYRSTSGGSPGTFGRLATNGIVAGEPFPWVTPLSMVAGTVFVGSHSVYRAAANQTTGSFTWTKIADNLTGGSSLSVLQTYTNLTRPWEFSAEAYAGSSNGRIFRSWNALAPTPVWTEITGSYPGGYVSDVAADPYSPLRVFVTRGAFGLSRLYRSSDGGATWAAVGSGLPNVPANAVAVDPFDPQRVFVGTDVGVFESLDEGDTFLPFSLGMPSGLVVTDLEIDDNPHVLVAGTYGRGAYRVALASTPGESSVSERDVVRRPALDAEVR